MGGSSGRTRQEIKGIFIFFSRQHASGRGRRDEMMIMMAQGAVEPSQQAAPQMSNSFFPDPLSGAFRPTPNILAASISRALSRCPLPPPVNVAPWIRHRPKTRGRGNAVQFGWSGRTTRMATARRPSNPNWDSGKLPRPPLARLQIIGPWFSCC